MSMFSVIFFLPALLMLCDGLIRHTTFDMRAAQKRKKEETAAAIQNSILSEG